MNIYLIYLLIGLICLGAGYFLGNYIQNLKTKSNQSTLEEERRQLDLAKKDLENRNLGLENEKEELRTEKEQLGNEIVRYQADLEHLSLKNKEQKGEVEQLQEKFTKEFENLANKILDEKSTKFTEQNQKNIKNILSPLQEKIKTFEDKVEKSQKESISMHSALKEQLLNLQNQNLKITQEAENLTKALKGDSKMQGNLLLQMIRQQMH